MIMPTIYFIILALFSILSYFLSLDKIIPFPYNLSGIIPIIIGIMLNLQADNLFKNNKTAVKPNEIPSELIKDGPFKMSRHPMYLGMSLILFGLGLIMQNWLAIIIPSIFVLIIELKFIPMEEENLEKTFGEEYSNYKKEVRRWI